MKGLGVRVRGCIREYLCWRCRRAAMRLRRHQGIFAVGGMRGVLDEITDELERAQRRGAWKRCRREAAAHPELWPAKLAASMLQRPSLPIALLEYPVNLRTFPSRPTMRRLH